MRCAYLVVHQYSSLAFAVPEDVSGEVVAVVPFFLEADCSCGLLGVRMSSPHRKIGREVDAKTLLPFRGSLEHEAPVGVIRLCHEGVLVIAEDVVGETVITCDVCWLCIERFGDGRNLPLQA